MICIEKGLITVRNPEGCDTRGDAMCSEAGKMMDSAIADC